MERVLRVLRRGSGGKTAPGLVVIQEWWGVNDHIKGVADRYAKHGFRVLIPDLYRGKVGLDAKEAEHLMTGLNFGDAAGNDIRGAVQYLKQSSPKVGVTGYCMGGALAILASVFVPGSGCGGRLVRFPAARIRGRLQDQGAGDGSFRDSRRLLQDRAGGSARREAESLLAPSTPSIATTPDTRLRAMIRSFTPSD
jgi:hypothetical protein